jgi:4-hydroxy-tetrahydrodipicolinate synthase
MQFRSDPASITGSIAPLVTPFTADGAVDHQRLRHLIRWQLESGSHAISLGGSTGEPSSQTVAERIAAMRTAAEEIADRVPFVPGTGSAKLDETLELSAAAHELGADAALVITPYYARPTQEGLYQWYATIARELPDLPIVLYNVPIRTAVDIAPETVARLRREFANIVGVKETTKDFEHFSRVIHLGGRDTLVWSGIELLSLPLLALGGSGFVSAVANIAPRAVAQMYQHWVTGEHEQARIIHYGLHPLVDLVFVETNPAPIKWVLASAGLIASGYVRPPLVGPSAAAQAHIKRLLIAGASLLDAPLAELARSWVTQNEGHNRHDATRNATTPDD